MNKIIDIDMMGILLNHEGREYVIPLTSAKEKHIIAITKS